MRLLEQYESPEMEVVFVDANVITSSLGPGIGGEDPFGEDGF